LRMDYLRPASPSRSTHCDAHCYRITRSVAFVRAQVHQGDRDEPVATAQAAFMLSTPSGRRPEADRDAVTPKATQAPATASAAAIAATAPPPERRDEAGWRAPAASEPAMPPGAIPYLDYLGIRVAPDPIAPTFRLPFDPKLVGNPF